MRSRDFAVFVLNRIEDIGVCLFCDDYESTRAPRIHSPICPVAEYLRTEHARRSDKTQRDRPGLTEARRKNETAHERHARTCTSQTCSHGRLALTLGLADADQDDGRRND